MAGVSYYRSASHRRTCRVSSSAGRLPFLSGSVAASPRGAEEGITPDEPAGSPLGAPGGGKTPLLRRGDRRRSRRSFVELVVDSRTYGRAHKPGTTKQPVNDGAAATAVHARSLAGVLWKGWDTIRRFGRLVLYPLISGNPDGTGDSCRRSLVR